LPIKFAVAAVLDVVSKVIAVAMRASSSWILSLVREHDENLYQDSSNF